MLRARYTPRRLWRWHLYRLAEQVTGAESAPSEQLRLFYLARLSLELGREQYQGAEFAQVRRDAAELRRLLLGLDSPVELRAELLVTRRGA